jgi:hypothetical protein
MADLSAPHGATPLPPDPKGAPPPKKEEPGGLSGGTIAAGVGVLSLIAVAAWPGSPAVALLTNLLFAEAMKQKPAPATAAELARGAGNVTALSAPPAVSGADSTALLRPKVQAQAGASQELAAAAPGVDQAAPNSGQLRALPQPDAQTRAGIQELAREQAQKPVPRPQLRGGRGFGGLGGGSRAGASGGGGGGAQRAGSGVAGLPPALMAIGMAEMARHPEVVPVLLKLVQYAKKDDQTGGFREAMAHCGSLYTCSPRGPGRTTFTLSDGLRVDYTYQRELPWGQRNHFDVTAPTGERAEFSDSPLLLDLDGAGFATEERRILYDLNGDGRLEALHAPRAGLGALAFGAAGDGRFLFGNRTDLDGDGQADGYADGFEALEAFIARAASEGVISRAAARSGRLGKKELAALSRRYGLRVLKGGLSGTALPPRQAGVAALLLSREPSNTRRDFDGRGDDVTRRAGAIFERADGSRGEYADVWFRAAPVEPGGAAR